MGVRSQASEPGLAELPAAVAATARSGGAAAGYTSQSLPRASPTRPREQKGSSIGGHCSLDRGSCVQGACDSSCLVAGAVAEDGTVCVWNVQQGGKEVGVSVAMCGVRFGLT